ncbi:tyrosine phosphatase family-domain-containing protein [Coniella lustricola]|uniref:diphosphoinositol-polyphosphate diphosphatase n=1 Tax=Coniella lustricola TaxID=2025994 RepID=A0A2T3AGI4_9PEZI|nr:tyrosine phosphatase family-domain-containing protein [Coniella lustricola]
MRREVSSGQSSLRSKSSVASLGTESSWSKEAIEVTVESGEPINFGTVVPGVYRSSYPQEADYPFIKKLGLKTIVTLVDKAFPETFLPFMETNGIKHCHIVMEGTKKQTIPVKTMSTILEVIHDKRNHPLLIHCNQGRHRTGCVVAITRKLQNWKSDRILEEYKSYAHPKIRDGDVEYISAFQVTDLQHLGLVPLSETAAAAIHAVHPRPRPIRLYAVAALIILVFITLWTSVPPHQRHLHERAPLGL